MRKLSPPPRPPTKDQLLEVFRRTVSPDYAASVEGDPASFALIESIAAQWARVAEGAATSVQSRYHLHSAYQTHEPASSGVKASGLITLKRVARIDQSLSARVGDIRIIGPGERVYLNTEPLLWLPNDTSERTIRFECEVTGFLGNLDSLADANGVLELELFELENQDDDKAAVGGTIDPVSQNQNTVWDSGRPDVFGPRAQGMFLRVSNSTVPANVGKIRKVVAFQAADGTEIPPGSGLYPNSVALSGLVVENPTEVAVYAATGGTYTDVTAVAIRNDPATQGFSPFPEAGSDANNDALYIGSTKRFESLRVELSDADAAVAAVWEFWNGSAWEALSEVEDRTLGLTETLNGNVNRPLEKAVTWTVPGDWASLASPLGSGVEHYYVRARVTSSTGRPVDNVRRVAVYNVDPLIAESNTLTWALLDYPSMGVELSEVQAIGGGRDNDLYILGAERGLYQQEGESDQSFRERITTLPDVVSPNAVRRVLNRALAPYGLKGAALDVGSGLTGMFFDTAPSLAPETAGAFDMYEPGDAFPEDPWILALSAAEAYGHGIVLVPHMSEGDFGMFFDEGPVYLDEENDGLYTGPAFGGWSDGYPVEAYALYQSIYNSLKSIIAAGVTFTMLRSDTVGDSC